MSREQPVQGDKHASTLTSTFGTSQYARLECITPSEFDARLRDNKHTHVTVTSQLTMTSLRDDEFHCDARTA